MMNNGLKFIGSVGSVEELPSIVSPGHLMCVGNDTYLYTGDNWEKLLPTIDIADTDNTTNAVKITARVCSQCGAPVNTHRISCEYCGVKYE